MPVEILTAAQRAEWERFPEEIDERALARCFSFPDDELERIVARRGAHPRFAVAASAGALRWLGFVPVALAELPQRAAALLAEQLDIDVSRVDPGRLRVGRDARADQISEAMAITGFRGWRAADQDSLRAWLGERALDHDGPLGLLRDAIDALRRERIVRPGLTVIERIVASAREDAEVEIHQRIQPFLTDELIKAFDELVRVGDGDTAAAVKLFGQETRSVSRIGEPLERLAALRRLGAEDWDLSGIPANRQRMLARYVRHATSQALARRNPGYRHPALLAFCAESSVRLTDEIVDLLDQGIGSQHMKARSALVALKLNVAEGANSSVLLLAELLEVLLDDAIPDAGVREAVWKRSTPEQLQQALELAEEIRRPEGDSHLDQLNDRYHATREFAPRGLAALRLRAGPGGERLLAAVELLRDLNARGARKVPDAAPVDFVPRAWRPYVLPAGGGIDRRYWELCLLSELRSGLRAGEIWVAGSRRYQDPERSLIGRSDWPHAREQVRAELELPATAGPRLDDLRARTIRHREQLDGDLAGGEAEVALDEHGNLKVSRLRAQPRDPAIDKLASEIANELAIVDLPDLLFDIDAATGFTDELTHAGGSSPRSKDHKRNLIAAIMALACNLGVRRMARSSGISPAALGWTAEWYLSHETLEAATARIVDHQSQIALAQLMGTGQHSSSDGKRRLVNPDSQQARTMPRYFGRHRGLTHYAFVSDQHTHFATRVIRTTVRDATYVLDGILDNQTQLPITTHSTDTAGYSDIIFALFDLLGLQFAPRLAGIADTRLWHDANQADTPAGRLVRHRVNARLIAEHWDEMLRLAGSLKHGTVTASLLVTRLHAQQRRSQLAAALQDYGRLVKTEFVLRYLTHPEQRRSIHRQLNKQENINWLEDQVFYGNNGKIRLHSLDRQSTQAAALALVATAIITWNTRKMNASVARRRATGEYFDDEQLGRLSPAICEHILINGRYLIDPDRVAQRPSPPPTSLAMPTYH